MSDADCTPGREPRSVPASFHLHFHAPGFRWFVIFMPCNLVRHFQVVHFQSKMFQQIETARRPPKGPKNVVFVPGDLDLWPLTLTFKLVRARDQTHLPCEFGANPFSVSRDISYANKKSYRQRQKQDLTQFTACGKDNKNFQETTGNVIANVNFFRTTSYM